jgi:amino acid adenylation domain-containing protein
VAGLIHQALEDAAQRDPDHPAVVDGDEAITYGELRARARQLAHRLADLGVGVGDRVALCVPRSIGAVVGVYGILEAGAAYVPLDPHAPVARLASTAADAAIDVVVVGAGRTGLLDQLGIANAVVVDGDPDELASQPTTAPGRAVTPESPAYVLYTSGSTGTPKGVMLSHGNALAFAGWAAEEFGLGPDDRVGSQAPFHFDLSTFDLFSSCWAASTVVITPDRAMVFPAQLARHLRDRELTVLYAVPSLLTALANRGGLEPGGLPSLRTILFAGEVFPVDNLRRLMALVPAARYANLYGPTETNVCCWYEVTEPPDEGAGPIPIGRAVPGDRLAVVTEEGTLAATEEVGELYVAGETVMLGYWNDPARTDERLVEVPGLTEPGERAYRTGDLVWVGADGDHRFVGRRDSQIKTRGYRVELGDIEANIAADPSVVECAVVAVPDEAVTNRLVAYVVLEADGDPRAVRAGCGDRLPAYMIPERFEVVRSLPTTSTGKVDRTRLAELAAAP